MRAAGRSASRGGERARAPPPGLAPRRHPRADLIRQGGGRSGRSADKELSIGAVDPLMPIRSCSPSGSPTIALRRSPIARRRSHRFALARACGRSTRSLCRARQPFGSVGAAESASGASVRCRRLHRRAGAVGDRKGFDRRGKPTMAACWACQTLAQWSGLGRNGMADGGESTRLASLVSHKPEEQDRKQKESTQAGRPRGKAQG